MKYQKDYKYYIFILRKRTRTWIFIFNDMLYSSDCILYIRIYYTRKNYEVNLAEGLFCSFKRIIPTSSSQGADVLFYRNHLIQSCSTHPRRTSTTKRREVWKGNRPRFLRIVTLKNPLKVWFTNKKNSQRSKQISLTVS
jgi:hypothetical protein